MLLEGSESQGKYFAIRLLIKIEFRIKREAPSDLVVALSKSRNLSLNNSLILSSRKLERRDGRLAINRWFDILNRSIKSFILIELYDTKIIRDHTLDSDSQIVSIEGFDNDILSLFDAQQNELKNHRNSLNPFYRIRYSSIVECLLSVRALQLLVFLVV